MKIIELFRRLAYGELSNLAINSGGGNLLEEKHPQIAQYVNEGLLALFSRFQLKESEVIIEQIAHVTRYHLKVAFAESTGSNVEYAYIKDLPDEPFTGDVIRILEVHDEIGKVVLNDQNNSKSMFTPQPDVLQVPTPVDGAPLTVVYQARHPQLDVRPGKIINQEIDIPFFLENALQNFIGYKAYSHMNGQENIVKGQEYMAAYEATCLDVELRDLVNQSFHTSHHKLEMRGFV